ncbi:MAG: four helix bundle protein [Bacteroidetes bacterium]|nr:four helix bundle protein [Bacteroidota bacterium]
MKSKMMEPKEEKAKKKNDLEERLINFAVSVLEVSEMLPDSRACNHLNGQLIRSGTSPALNYGEAFYAESRNDFIHKLKICLKELNETKICLAIIKRRGYANKDLIRLEKVINENVELVNIFTKSAKTASENRNNRS